VQSPVPRQSPSGFAEFDGAHPSIWYLYFALLDNDLINILMSKSRATSDECPSYRQLPTNRIVASFTSVLEDPFS
jgi:hypothetical protein